MDFNVSALTPSGQPRFYMTQVVPNPSNTSIPLVVDFQTAYNAYYQFSLIQANFSRAYVPFEGIPLVSFYISTHLRKGYITGRLIVQALQATREVGNKPLLRCDLQNRSVFIDTFWQQTSYLISGCVKKKFHSTIRSLKI